MTPLRDLLLDMIRSAGPIPFAEYMSLALYHPEHGYYTAGAHRSGWQGDSLTSPELDPAFGHLWAQAIEQVWEGCGRPDRFDLVEIGPGEGGFAAAVLPACSPPFGASLTFRLVEPIPALERRQRRRLQSFPRVSWSRTLEEVSGSPAGCVFANEVLDNLPVHLVEKKDGELVEVYVDARGSELTLTLGEPSTADLARFLRDAEMEPGDGGPVAVGLAAERLVTRAAGLMRQGALIMVDYGRDEAGPARRGSDTVMTYSTAGVEVAVLDRPGHRDITAHVDWASVRRTCARAGLDVFGPFPQRYLLRALGAEDLDQRLRDEHLSAAARGQGAAAVRALSRRQAMAALTDPGGLGGHGVLVGLSGMAAPEFLSKATI